MNATFGHLLLGRLRSGGLPEQDGGEPRSRCHETTEQFDENGQRDGFRRVDRRCPRICVCAVPLYFGQVHAEEESEEQSDNGDDEEADDAEQAADDQGAVGYACLLESFTGPRVFDDAGGDERDGRDGEHGPGDGAACHDCPDGDGGEDEDHAGQDRDDDAEQSYEDGESDEEFSAGAHCVVSVRDCDEAAVFGALMMGLYDLPVVVPEVSDGQYTSAQHRS